MSWPNNISPTSVEVAERDALVFFRYERLRRDSGGRGQWPGGLGEEVCFVSRHERPLSITFLSERMLELAPGLGGECAGAQGDVRINGAAINTWLPNPLNPGNEVIMRTCRGRRLRARS